MFIIELIYKVPLEELDTHMAAHVKYLNKHYKKGDFLISGRKIPRTGGIIIAVATAKSMVEKWIAEDPFHQHDLADFNIIEFNASQIHPDVKHLL